MVFERGLAGEGVLDGLAALVVGIGRFGLLPVVGVVLHVFAPVELVDAIELLHFDGRIAGLTGDHRSFLGTRRRVPFVGRLVGRSRRGLTLLGQLAIRRRREIVVGITAV